MAKERKTSDELNDPKVDTKIASAKEAKKKAYQDAKSRVRDYIKTLSSDDLLKADLVLLVGTGQRASRGPVSSINTVLRDAIIASGDEGLSEMDIFKQFKIGRPEMTTKIRIFVKTPNPDDRVWVNFDESTEIYKVVGLGKDAPEGWDGFVPADENIL